MALRPSCPASLHWPPYEGVELDIFLKIDIKKMLAVGGEAIILTAEGDCQKKHSSFAVKLYMRDEPLYQSIFYRYFLSAPVCFNLLH